MVQKNDPAHGRHQDATVLTQAGLDESTFLNPGELVNRLLALFASPTYRPPVLPSVAIELLELSRRPDVEFRNIRALLEKEPLLAARVLRVAQSALYTKVEPVRSIEQAMMQLGLRTLADLFLEAALTLRVFRAPGFDEPMNKLRRHSTATAHIARLICRRTSMLDEYAFLCGLLHDVGIASSLIAISDVARQAKRPEFSQIWPAVVMAHEQAGTALAGLWKLPKELSLVVGSHHRIEPDRRPHALALVTCAAEYVASLLGAGMFDEVNESMAIHAVEMLGVAGEPFDRILDAAGELMASIE